jgi:hypothetical protein
MDAASLYFLARKLKAVALADLHAAAPSLPLAHAVVVAEAARQPGITVGEIAARHAMAQSLVSTAVLALQGTGAIRASPDPADRRRTVLELGRSTITRHPEAARVEPADALGAALGSLSARDRAAVMRGLNLLERALKAPPPKKAISSRRREPQSG